MDDLIDYSRHISIPQMLNDFPSIVPHLLVCPLLASPLLVSWPCKLLSDIHDLFHNRPDGKVTLCWAEKTGAT